MPWVVLIVLGWCVGFAAVQDIPLRHLEKPLYWELYLSLPFKVFLRACQGAALIGTVGLAYDLLVPKPRRFAMGAWGCAGSAVVFGVIMFMVAVPKLTERPHGNETYVIGALKMLGTSQSLFRESDKEGDGNLDYGTLAELGRAGTQGLIDSLLASGTKHGYLFECTYGASTSEFIWYATARPMRPVIDGDRYFAVNQTGVTYYTVSQSFRLNGEDCTVPAGVNPVGK